jgi:GNAT superfamily N-acetyltransferase
MDAAGIELLEQAAFEGWPAQDTESVAGWQLRFAGGYTKRANSANSTARATLLDAALVTAIEARYRARGLPPIFRLTSGHAASVSDGLLADLGYQRVDPSLVLQRALGDRDGAEDPPLLTEPADWLAAFQEVAGRLGPEQAQHLALLQAIRAPRVLALTGTRDQPVCCGLGVLVGNQLGLFDLATHPDHRRQGHAADLCRRLMGWGQRRGAKQAFLQVVAGNLPAIALYEWLGFGRAYEYWYRVAH